MATKSSIIHDERSQFILACRNGDMEPFREIFAQRRAAMLPDFHYINSQGLTVACEHGHLGIVKEILEHRDLENRSFSETVMPGFIAACTYDQAEIVRFLTSSPELTEHIDKPGVIFDNMSKSIAAGRVSIAKHLLSVLRANDYENYPDHLNRAVLYSLWSGQTGMVKSLVESDDFSQFADGRKWCSYGVDDICVDGNLGVLKFMLDCPELAEHIDIRFRNDLPLRKACQNGHANIASYLIEERDFYTVEDVKKLDIEGNDQRLEGSTKETAPALKNSEILKMAERKSLSMQVGTKNQEQIKPAKRH